MSCKIRNNQGRYLPRIDWPSAKAEYVSDPTVRMDDIANKYGTRLSTVQAYAARDKWMEARNARNELLLQKASEKSVHDAFLQLSKCNREDIHAAAKLRHAVVKLLEQGTDDLSAIDLRALAGTLESAQRVARLALGAPTENTMLRPALVEPDAASGDALVKVDYSVTPDRVLDHLACMAFFDPRNLLTATGQLRPLHLLDKATAMGLQGVDIGPAGVQKYRYVQRNEALRMLSDYLHMMTEMGGDTKTLDELLAEFRKRYEQIKHVPNGVSDPVN